MKRLALLALLAALLLAPPSSRAHFSPKAPAPWAAMSKQQKQRWLRALARHARLECRRGHARDCQQLRQVRRWQRKLQRPPSPSWRLWRSAQVWLAEKIAPLHRDAWPNCPDPWAGGGSWDDTAHCEARGTFESLGSLAWAVDPPGFFRCALQFDPGWEPRYAPELRRRFGQPKVCP